MSIPPDSPVRKRDRTRSDVSNLPLIAPAAKRSALEDSDDTPMSRTVDHILSHPLNVYGAGPSSFSLIDTPLFGAPLASKTTAPETPEPSQHSVVPPGSKGASQGSSEPPPASSPLERLPTFKATPLSLPLDIPGDTCVPPGPQRPVHHTRDQQGLLNCAVNHADAAACLPFEVQMNTSAFNHQVISSDADFDVDGLDDLLSFDLGTFIWTEEFEERESNAFEQGVLVLVALIRILAPSHLKKASVWIGEDIPSDYEQYKKWCLEPAEVLGGQALKTHQILLALKDLWEDDAIQWAVGV
ncbi:hypothetical protein TWF281_004630 [Arthrobotrys megalospora]